MNEEELKKWMIDHKFANAFRVYVTNVLRATQAYAPYATIPEKGYATVNVHLSPKGVMVLASETFEGEIEIVKKNLEEAQKTIKTQAKEIKALTEQNESLQTQTQEVAKKEPEEPTVTTKLTRKRAT